jgi:hypothetical protein
MWRASQCMVLKQYICEQGTLQAWYFAVFQVVRETSVCPSQVLFSTVPISKFQYNVLLLHTPSLHITATLLERCTTSFFVYVFHMAQKEQGICVDSSYSAVRPSSWHRHHTAHHTAQGGEGGGRPARDRYFHTGAKCRAARSLCRAARSHPGLVLDNITHPQII